MMLWLGYLLLASHVAPDLIFFFLIKSRNIMHILFVMFLLRHIQISIQKKQAENISLNGAFALNNIWNEVVLNIETSFVTL